MTAEEDANQPDLVRYFAQVPEVLGDFCTVFEALHARADARGEELEAEIMLGMAKTCQSMLGATMRIKAMVDDVHMRGRV